MSGEVESDNERVIDLPPMPIAYNVRELNVVIQSGQLQLMLATGWSQQSCFNCNVLCYSFSIVGRIFAQSAKGFGFNPRTGCIFFMLSIALFRILAITETAPF